MAGRGSGIGMSATAGVGYGPSNGVSGDTRTGALYGGSNGFSMKGLRPHHWLWILVALEIGTLVLLRFTFRRYHGG